MKRILLSFVLCAGMFGQVTPNIWHLDRSTQIDLHPTLTDNGIGSENTSFSFLRIDPASGANTLSGISIPTTAAITGDNTASQTVHVSSTDGISALDVVVIDAGLSTQEMLQVQSVTSTTFDAVVIASHSSGARVRKVFSAYTKFLQMQIAGANPSGVNNIQFVRQFPLPANVYDQYKLISSAGGTCTRQEDSATPDVYWMSAIGASSTIPMVPQYDSGSLSSTGTPTNGVDLGSSGPYATTLGSTVTACVQVSLVFTQTPEPSTYGIDYRFYWDH